MHTCSFSVIAIALLQAIVGAKLLRASKIIGVDLNKRKKEKAELFGMTDFINPIEIENNKTPVEVEVIQEMTDGMGVDYSFECSGAGPAAMGRGLTIVVGLAPEEDATISRMALVFGGTRPRSDLPSVITKCIYKEIQLDEMLTHQVDLDDINHAFELPKDVDCLKVVIKINDK